MRGAGYNSPHRLNRTFYDSDDCFVLRKDPYLLRRKIRWSGHCLSSDAAHHYSIGSGVFVVHKYYIMHPALVSSKTHSNFPSSLLYVIALEHRFSNKTQGWKTRFLGHFNHNFLLAPKRNSSFSS